MTDSAGGSGPAAAVITVSDRVCAGRAEDRSGPLAALLLNEAGLDAALRTPVPDELPAISAAVEAALAAGARVVVLTGGTGVGPRDVTPEAVRPLLDKELPGVAEAIRAYSRASVPSADLSRALAGIRDSALVVALPGSTGGVRDGLAVVVPLIDHTLKMLAGEGHAVPSTPSASRVRLAEVTERPLDLAAHARLVSDAAYGAVATFSGVVRDHDDGRSVTALAYEGHPAAGRILARVAEELAATEGVGAVAVSHRVGPLAIGDVALAIAVSAAHRGPALATCTRLVDEVKDRVPIWKQQHFASGESEWVNSP